MRLENKKKAFLALPPMYNSALETGTFFLLRYSYLSLVKFSVCICDDIEEQISIVSVF